MDESKELERKQLLSYLLDAVKQCQLKFNGKHLLATEKNENIRDLCSSFENVFRHGLKELQDPPSSLKQFTDVTGLSKLTSILLLGENTKDQKSTFWSMIKWHLSRHELERFENLKNVKTDVGKIRAWFRSALNEHALERYLHSIINQEKVLQSSYESWSFMLDDEKAVALPNIAAGLSMILFALSIDKSEFDENLESVVATGPDLPVAVRHSQIVCDVRSKRKKKQAKVIHFDDAEGDGGSISDKRFDGVRRSATEDSLSLDIDRTSRRFGAFSFEDEPLIDRAFDDLSRSAKEKHVSVSKSESDLKMLDDDDDTQLSRFEPFTKENIRDSYVCPGDAPVTNVRDMTFVDADTTSESYGSFDSRDLICSDVLKQLTEDDRSDGRRSGRLGQDGRDDQCSAHSIGSSSALELSPTDLHFKELIPSPERSVEVSREKLDGKSNADVEDRLAGLERENSLLREQLRSYIAAMKVLENNVDDAPNEREPREMSDYEHKLVQIAEMHAELVEFNGVLLKKLALKEKELERANLQLSNYSRPQKVPSIGGSRRRFNPIDVIIPSAFLHGSPTHSYHVYQVYVKIGADEWNVYRRYTEFHDLHCELRKYLKNVKNLDFPPKRVFGKKDPKLVEERRRRLEEYLKKIVGIIIEKCPQLSESPSRLSLIAVIPFFNNNGKRSWNVPNEGVLRLSLSDDASQRSYSGL